MIFKNVVHSITQFFSGKIIRISEMGLHNFIYAEVAMGDHRKDHFYVLKSFDDQWALSKPIEENSGEITFIDEPVVSEHFKNLFGIEILSADKLHSKFERLEFMDKSWDKDLKYWKPNTLGEALFNWWD